MVWRTGDHCRITLGTRSVDGTVVLASRNGRSLMLTFDGIIVGHVGAMPVLMGDDGVFRSLVGSHEVSLQRRT